MSQTLFRCLFTIILLGLHTPVLAACEPNGAPTLKLSVTAAQVSVADRTLTLQVYDNGCVALHRPSFYRAAGDFRVTLTATELTGLRQVITPERVRQIDRAALMASANARSSVARVEVLQVQDADLYVLEAGVGADAIKQSAFGVLAGAEVQPDNADLQAMSVMVQALLALETRADAVKVSAP